MRLFFTIATGLTLTAFTHAAVDFERDINPILTEHCLDCHGPEKQKSDLRVDQRPSLLVGGDSGLAAIIPGNPEQSLLIEAIHGKDEDTKMPPKGDPLTPKQIALLETWIKEGAQWPGQMDAKVKKKETDHWSFQPIKRATPPNAAKNPIDAFLNQKLAADGITPNERADARTLVRRASLTLTGLPPTADEVSAFEKAHAAAPSKAYDALVDKLLASDRFGERWAQHWLDVTRWAESNGSESNLYRNNSWLFRDYVIDAFNADKPYDQFVREQLAGDQLEAGPATGFLVAGPHVPPATVGEQPTAIRQARADRMDEIIQTVGASMMGVTMSCARCHNHKFDPISIRDYYAMAAVFQDIEFGVRLPEFPKTNPVRQRGEVLLAQIEKERDNLRKTGPWLEDWGYFKEVLFAPTNTQHVRIEFTSKNANLDEIEISGPNAPTKDLALEHLGAVAHYPKEMVKSSATEERFLIDGLSELKQKVQMKATGKEKPWVEIQLGKTERIDRIRLSSNRIYFRETSFIEVGNWAKGYNFFGFVVKVKQPNGTWLDVASTAKIQGLDKKNQERRETISRIAVLAKQLQAEGPQASFIGSFIKPEITRVLQRGSPENPRDEVNPAGIEILQGDLQLDGSTPGGQRRLAFADWLISDNNPLTSRVMANRLWHHVFGQGLVPTTSDFGIAGMTPSHPELLDWLAVEFSEGNDLTPKKWSVKQLLRLMVTTEAFQRSSAPTPASLQKDATAVSLWRFPPRRMDAEIIRDSILSASANLNAQIGGPSYRIHNIKKTYSQWEVVDNFSDKTWRRMIYQERMRRVDDQIFTAFDFPDCGQVRAKRPVSTTPLQALNLMNSPFVVSQANEIAKRAKSEANTTEDAIRKCFLYLLNREPSSDELQASLEVAESATLALVCRSLINTNEFSFLP